MFTDARSKTIIFVAHCILNQNSISDGTANYPGTITEIIELLNKSGIGIVQLPCPELICLGLDRGNIKGCDSPVMVENTRIRKLMEQEPAKSKIRQLVEQVVFQISEYVRYGFDIKGIVGINRSPSCGVDTTSKGNREVAGEGVFIEELRNKLEKNNINLRFVGIKSSEPEKAVAAIKRLVGGG
jgi:predicted secreted protein